MIETVTEETYKIAFPWWESRNWPILPFEHQPDTCFFSKEGNKYIMFVALYLPKKPGGGVVGWMEQMTGNPDTTFEERQKAIKELIEHTDKIAKDYGIYALLTVTPNVGLIKHLNNLGYMSVETGNTSLVKSLY